ncbi:DoxX family membrane protein [Halalkalicoccus jeotgali]|uniref:DoxX family protein n=1 Tax=Halalkalicoccus jeotgali (strain DSM 18796 / CECT 7217 / JCM 14584 / KCTC 4019 / B3) TaxID=795797 RepID=D8J407_HALJB|nr:DoxX family membrane protein [Halalkalicoccus jeotgali]ADJ15399.1 DoxX family protein [Halalkalicoccus jeotgali B3]ELY35825.1 DoxX family protein [Halalkalicoccus jeotgali B3]
MVSDPVVPASVVSALVLQNTPFDAPLAAELFFLGRVLFGSVLAFNGLNHFLDVEAMTEYAESKGVPKPMGAVVLTGGMLVVGGVGTVLGLFRTFSVGALATFLLVATPVMHDFWAVPNVRRDREVIHFTKNATMLGAALVLLALSGVPWPYVPSF